MGSMGASAAELKDQGNRFYQKRMYDEAIGCYNRAIVKNPEMAVLFANRSLCFMSLKQWDKASQDARKATELDRQSVKAHYFLGRALSNLGLYDEAIKILTKAHDLSKSQKLNFGDEITGMLRTARREKFAMEEEKRVKQEIELESFLARLILEEKEREKAKLLV